MDVLVLVLVLLLTGVLYWMLTRHDPRLPPMPCRPYPILGHLLHLEKNPRPQFKQWQKKCGDIFSLYMGSSHVVVLNGYELIKEAFVKHGDICSDRPYMLFDAATGSTGRGISFSSGSVWREQRAVTMNIFRTLGVGRSIVALKITQIAAMNNEALARLKGEAANIKDIIITSVTNVTCYILVGHMFTHDDKIFIVLCQNVREMVLLTRGTTLGNFLRWLQWVPGDPFKIISIRKCADLIMQNFVVKYVLQKGYDEYDETNLNNFIALYRHEMKKHSSSGEPTSLNKENLIKVIFDLFVAGMETTSITLVWCVLYMLRYPEIQEQAFREIEHVLGTEQQIYATDKSKLPFVNAVIMEVQRIVSMVALGLTHLSSEDFNLRGFLIPKGTQIISNLDSVLFEKSIWGDDTKVFRPERFLDENGKLKSPNEFIPFGIGKRFCAGEGLAKMELFVFFSSMVQKFKFVLPSSDSPPSLEPEFGMSCCPQPFQVCVVERKRI